MKTTQIRLGSTDSTDSLNKKNLLDLQLEQDSEPLLFTNVDSNVDSQEVFNNERDECTKYRIALTFMPIMTNICHNVQTEIAKNEGTDKAADIQVVTDVTNAVVARGNRTGQCMGMANPTREQMLRNTEYTKSDIGFEYHIGDDILNNHILRGLVFTSINQLATMNHGGNSNETTVIGVDGTKYMPQDDESFNTLYDYARLADGQFISDFYRISAKSVEQTKRLRHAYPHKYDVMTIEESYSQNVLDKDGWIGIKNKKLMETYTFGNNNNNNNNNNMGISCLLNNKDACEFIDFYPDRTLYSFSPKLNTFRHRYEYNWDICLTYPFKNYYDNEVVENANHTCNALRIVNVTKITSDSGTNVLVFRSSVKHNLVSGNSIYLYYSDKDGERFTKIEESLNITDVHGIGTYDTRYFFAITKMDILSEILGTDIFDPDTGNLAMTDNQINNELQKHQIRFTHLVNGVESEYYIRLFRKLPNFKFATEPLTDEIAKNDTEFTRYIRDNASYNAKYPYEEAGKKYLYPFENSQGNLPFSQNIFNDKNYQIIFNDSIDIDKIRDNRGRPLHEVFATVVKLNRGYKKWYKKGGATKADYVDPEVEFSHCFGRLTSTLELSEDHTIDMGSRQIMSMLGKLCDCRYANEFNLNTARTLDGTDYEITSHGITKRDPAAADGEYSGKDIFFGDVVEYNSALASEFVLSDVQGRFNTAQRELKVVDNNQYQSFLYEEIQTDDYDPDGFVIKKYQNKNNPNGAGMSCVNRPEGYYYKMHYDIPLKQFGTLQQGSHDDIRVSAAAPYQSRGMFIMITTPYAYAGLFKGDRMFICDDGADEWYESYITSRIDDTHFCISPIKEMNWVRVCNLLMEQDDDKRLRLRHCNSNIPDYASKVGDNMFFWRNLMNYGDANATDLTDLQLYNGNIYADKQFMFVLRRQDPYGERGLASTQGVFPLDITSVREGTPTTAYKEEDKTC